MHVGAVNENLAEMNAEPVLDTGRHIRTDVGRDTWQDTSEGGRLGSSLADKLAELEILTLAEKIANKIAYIHVFTLASY